MQNATRVGWIGHFVHVTVLPTVGMDGPSHQCIDLAEQNRAAIDVV